MLSTPQAPLSQPLKVIFMGTPDIAVPCLTHLYTLHQQAAWLTLKGIVTQPDRPSGRGQKLTPPAIKACWQAHHTLGVEGILLFQPERLSKSEEVLAWLVSQAPDVIVTMAFGQILPQSVLDIPRLGVVNVHASLLPRWRGANPIASAILHGDEETGLTTMKTVMQVDAGDMLLKASCPITMTDTTLSLSCTLATLAGPLLEKTLYGLYDGTLTPIPQKDAEVTHAPKMSKDDTWVHWHQQDALTLHRRMRAYTPWPGNTTYWQDKRVKLSSPLLPNALTLQGLQARVSHSEAPVVAGTLVAQGLLLETSLLDTTRSPVWIYLSENEFLGVETLQLEGKTSTSATLWLQQQGIHALVPCVSQSEPLFKTANLEDARLRFHTPCTSVEGATH
ncbi:MAG: methionyl-tRNA formyltransferase [Vampirovibrionales bacterium]